MSGHAAWSTLHDCTPEQAARRIALGDTVADVLRDTGRSHTDFADTGVCSRATLSRIVNGHHSPNVELLWDIAAELGVPLSTLIRDAEQRITPRKRPAAATGP